MRTTGIIDYMYNNWSKIPEVSLSLSPKTRRQDGHIYPVPVNHLSLLEPARKELASYSLSIAPAELWIYVCILYVQYINVIPDYWDLKRSGALCKNKALNIHLYSVWVEPKAERKLIHICSLIVLQCTKKKPVKNSRNILFHSLLVQPAN